ncbi:hypothetical protein [Polynucleobacter sinensis]|uniref:hypothetical protein n=1 Tax=Polynucleobacter sinensis TaxID=1743157 RepID=UPI001C129F04|nr:hypothetical protein [Polynucleobacter sinensis]
MKKIFNLALVALLTSALLGCVAPGTPTVGINCNYSSDVIFTDLPLVCQGR